MRQPDLLTLVVLGLACWRLCSLALTERGPGAVFVWFRSLWGVEHDEAGAPVSWPDTEAGRILSCTWCCGLWIAPGLVGLYLALPEAALAAAFPFAVSAVAIAFQEVVDGQGQH